jgi:ParB/RepB/Spo0J family partition protein
MQIYQRPLSDIKPYEKNPRQKYDIQKVAQSIKEFGFQQPIVVDRAGVIIVGHGRYQASKSLGLETVPVVIADLSPEKAKAYRIADNKTNEYSDWDFSLLNKEFTELLDVNFDLELTGFDPKELEDFFTFDKEDDVTKIKTEKSCPNCGSKLK